MKTHHNHHHPAKLKTTPRPLFSCAFFRQCTQTALSPTNSLPPSLPPPPPQQSSSVTAIQPPPQPPPRQTDYESSSSNTSQSFTQWKFPLPLPSPPRTDSTRPVSPTQKSDSVLSLPPPISVTELQELYDVAEFQLSNGSGGDRVRVLHMLERSLVPNPHSVGEHALCPLTVMREVVSNLKERTAAKPATKVLLALCLAEGNRHVAVEAGAVGRVVEALSDLAGPSAERALAALELLCTVAEGSAEVRAHALAVPMLVEVMGKMEGRGKEYAIGVLSVIYGGGAEEEEVAVAPPEELARAVVLALQGDSTARGKKKGAQLLKILQDNGRLDLTQYGNG